MNLQDAARMLGVHYQTAYKWVRSGTLAAAKHGATYEVSEAEIARFVAARRQPSRPPDRLRVRTWDAHIERLAAAMTGGEENAAWVVVERMASGGVPVLEICQNLLTPVIAELGERWSHGKISKAHELRAMGICDRMIVRIQVHPRGRPRGTVVVTTPLDDPHVIPALMAALVLRADRWKVHHVVGNVAAADITSLAGDVGADLVVLSTMVYPTDGALDKYVIEIEKQGFPVLVGTHGASLTDLLALARRHCASSFGY